MTPEPTNKLLRQLFSEAVRAQPTPVGPHVVDDDELLACLSGGRLSPADREQVTSHLASCEHCRRELLELMRAGVVQVADESIFSADRPASAVDAPRASLGEQSHHASILRFPQSTFARGLFALAAMLLVALTTYFAWPSGSEQMLAQARTELDAGNATSALATVQTVLDQEPSGELRTRSMDLLNDAAYTLARENLTEGDFQGVAELANLVGRFGPPSVELTNLTAQAERRMDTEIALAQVGSLTAYGYALDGGLFRDVPPNDEAERTEAAEKTLEGQVPTNPRVVAFWLNLGQLKLQTGHFAAARDSFEHALKLDPKDPLAHLGLGLVAFEEREFAEALDYFEEAAKFAPDNAAIQINLAICLTKLARLQDAIGHFNRAQELTTDPKLRQAVSAQIDQLKKAISQQQTP